MKLYGELVKEYQFSHLAHVSVCVPLHSVSGATVQHSQARRQGSLAKNKVLIVRVDKVGREFHLKVNVIQRPMELSDLRSQNKPTSCPWQLSLLMGQSQEAAALA